MARFGRRALWISLSFCLCLCVPGLAAAEPTVTTDYPDYYPGEYVIVSGTGWWPGETVSLTFNEDPFQHLPHVLTSVADSTGAFTNGQYLIEDHDLGTTFTLVAVGGTSGLIAQVIFTDSPKVGTVAVGLQNGTVCSTTGGTATYSVTVNRGSGGGSSGSFTANLTISGLPAGVGFGFGTTPLAFTPSEMMKSTTLTLSTTGTPSGTTAFTVRAATSANDFATGSGTLLVNQPPSVSCPAPITVNSTTGLCGAIVNFAAVGTGTPTPSVTYSKDPGTIFPVGTTTVTATATNSCGSADCTFTVTVLDNEAPSISVSNITTSMDPGQCTANPVLGATAADNCAIQSLVGTRSDALALGSPFPQGTTTITWTATDIHGNSTTATQLVTVNDTENPTITAPGALTRNTGAGAAACGLLIDDATLGTPTADDNCSFTVSRTGVPAGNLFPVGETTITYTVTDASGNSASSTQTITVVDNTPPVITTASISTSTDPDLCSAAVTTGTTATDNCGATTLEGVRGDGASLSDPYPVGSTTITWTATDVHGNSAVATQQITVSDNQNPTITTANISVSTDPGLCSASVALGTTADDNCGIATLNGERSDALAMGSPFPQGTTTVTWTATDIHGNSTTATQIVTVSDTENPTITAPGALTRHTGAGAATCGLLIDDATLGNPTADDNCTFTVSRTGVPAGNLFPVGETTITYTITDASGNSAISTQTITVVDNTPPVITTSNISTSTDPGLCGATVTMGTTATDNCGATTLEGVRGDGASLSDPYPAGSTTITWTATDVNGNIAVAIQQITVSDHQDPTITAANISVSTDPNLCSAAVNLGTTAADNCGIATLNGERSDALALSSPFPTGTTTIIWTATDIHGNSSTATQQVTVSDTENPTITAPGAITLNTGAGATTCGLLIDDATLGTPAADDNCSFTVSRTGVPAGNLFPVGETTITYTITDANGNSASATQTITVVDNTPPVITTADIFTSTDPGLCAATVTTGTTATDNCGVESLTAVRGDGSSLGDPFPQGSTTITWTALDVHGSTSTAVQHVVVNDTEAPSLTPPPAVDMVTGQAATTCGAFISDAALGTPIANDNCSFTTVRTGVPAGNVFPVGTTTITYTATDPSGNEVVATQFVTVTDNAPPALTAPAAVTVSTGPTATGCGLVVTNAVLGAATATDNCSFTLTRTGVPEGNLFPLGTTTVTYTASDPSGNTTTQTQLVTVLDGTPPRITTAAITVPTDPGLCSATIASLGTTVSDNCDPTPSLVGTRSDGAPLNSPYPKGPTTITWTAADAAGNSAGATQTITVTNSNPVVTMTGTSSVLVVSVGTPVTFTGTFVDDAGDVHTATWTCDALSTTGVVNEAAKTVSMTRTFTSAGVFFVTLVLTDQCGTSSTARQIGGLDAMVVVYDPSAGFVTGGGWIQSPAGAYVANPALTGKANFGFVSKYKKGQSTVSLTGETEFQFKAGDLNFHSTSYEWLVIAGSKAQYKGLGTINGAGSYGFLLSAVDGQVSGGGGSDKFRIKITDKATGLLAYDNQFNAPEDAAATTALGGGSIAIHANGGQLSAAAPSDAGEVSSLSVDPAANGLSQNQPNPFNPETAVQFSLARAGRVTLRVFDVRGSLVRTIVDETLEAGPHVARWNGATDQGGRVSSGVYFAILSTQDGYQNRIRMVLVK